MHWPLPLWWDCVLLPNACKGFYSLSCQNVVVSWLSWLSYRDRRSLFCFECMIVGLICYRVDRARHALCVCILSCENLLLRAILYSIYVFCAQRYIYTCFCSRVCLSLCTRCVKARDHKGSHDVSLTMRVVFCALVWHLVYWFTYLYL